MKRFLRTLLALGALLAAGAAHGHAASTAYLDLRVLPSGGVALQWVVALRDLDAVLDLDADTDGRLTWSEVTAQRAAIETLAREAVRLTAADGASCTLDILPLRFAQLESGGHAALDAKVVCPAAGESRALDYRFLAGVDAGHRVLLALPGDASPRPLGPGQRFAFDSADAPSGFTALLASGVTHILGGPDHLLFLVALLLPAVVTRTGGRWAARVQLKPALLDVVWIATAFTVAHSITLGLASFQLVSIPARFIEPLIAFTVLAAALNNLKPMVTRRLGAVAFGFGLIHGFGFAEVLAPLGLPPRELAVALFGFNLGVEIGQLAIVVGAFTLLALARRWNGYPRWILGAGSAALALTASIWIVERVFDVPIFVLAVAGG